MSSTFHSIRSILLGQGGSSRTACGNGRYCLIYLTSHHCRFLFLILEGLQTGSSLLTLCRSITSSAFFPADTAVLRPFNLLMMGNTGADMHTWWDYQMIYIKMYKAHESIKLTRCQLTYIILAVSECFFM